MYTPTAYPRANGLAEKMNGTLLKLLRKTLFTYPTTWDILLPHILHSIRITMSRATKMSPYYIVFGRDPPFEHTSFDIEDSNE